MQLAVIDDLITQYKAVIKKYPDNAPKAIAYLSGFIDCAYIAELISKSDYDEFKTKVLELQTC